ncbi:MAG TPA: TetR/AcrR family transcriptional regulator [Microbacterium sp.]|nr:TetR/AcrR family transcriptional regulator [Microbacterium sp.]HIE60126.1 TetR/AcrR family transcriptional regulator [Microbacterium sp.]|tara:strand:+ start:818 stop:1492 length:675 start_codon:yes stop_codon:yes gene_type:complete
MSADGTAAAQHVLQAIDGIAPDGVRGRERTKARLMRAAYEVFAEVGLDGASVEAICERAGFTRGAFYSNFSTKEELFFELVRAVTDRKLEAVSQRVDGLRAQDAALTPNELVQSVLDGTVEGLFDVVLMSEIRLRAMRDDETARAYLAWASSLIDRVQRMIESLVTSYGLRLRLPARDVARLVLTVWEDALITAAIERIDDDGLRRRAESQTQQLALALVDAAS